MVGSLGQRAKSGGSLQALALKACVRLIGREHINVINRMFPPSARTCTLAVVVFGLSSYQVSLVSVPGSLPPAHAGLHLELQTVFCPLVQSIASQHIICCQAMVAAAHAAASQFAVAMLQYEDTDSLLEGQDTTICRPNKGLACSPVPIRLTSASN